MKTFRKLCSAILVVAMLMSMVSVSVFAEEAEETTVEVELKDITPDNTVGTAVTNLVKLGIINGYEDGTFRPDNTITRGEFSKIVTTFLNIDSLASANMMSGFADVDDINHWAKAYIRLAADKKIVNGYEDGTFRPDAPVKYVEAVKMLVCALGYGEIAASKTVPGGEWYTGYMALAAEKGILRNADVNNKEDYASRGTVAILTNNSLEVPLAETSVGGQVTIDSEKTALSELQGKEKVTGIVTDIYTTGLTRGATGLTKRNIIVKTNENGPTEYQVPKNTDVYSLLGYKISGYSEDGSLDDADQLSQIGFVKNQNTTTVVTDTMIDDISGNTFYYYESDSATKRSKIVFDSDMSVIYNGKYISEYDDEDFLGVKSGKIKFVCNDGDGQAEVAFIESYENYVVSSVDNKNARPMRVNTKYGADELFIPIEDNNYHFSLTKAGSSEDDEVRLAESLREWNVISVKESKPESEGKAVWEGIISDQKISGKVEETLSETEKRIKGKVYKLAYNYVEFEGSKPEFNLDDQVTAYLDANGYIAAATSTSADSNIYAGYLINAHKEDGVGDEGYASIYGITGTTGQRTLKFASSARIDGTQYRNIDGMLEALGEASLVANANKVSTEGEEGEEAVEFGGEAFTLLPYSQMVRYSLNSANEITMIDTVLPNTSEGADDLELSIAFPNLGNAREDKTYTYDGSGRFKSDSGFEFSANSSTKVLIVPFDVSDVSKYSIKTYTSAFSTNKRYRVEAYNINEVDAAKYIIYYKGGTATVSYNDASGMMLAKEVVSVLDSEDNGSLDKATGYNFRDGNDLVLQSRDSGFFLNDIQPGEIFWYVEDEDKVVDKKMILAIENNKPVFYNYDGEECLGAVETAEDANELRTYKVDDVTRADNSSHNRFYFGTVIGMADGQLSLTNTLHTDECGVTEDIKETFTIGSSTKIYLYDFSSARAENLITAGASIDNIKSVKSLQDAANSEEIDFSKASQVLVYQRSGSVKTLIIFKY